MKINSAYLDNYLNKLHNVRFALVYGQEEGQIRLVNQKMQKHFLKDSDADFDLVSFHFKQLRDDLGLLKNEMASVSLLGGNKVIVVEDCPATIPKEFQDAIKSPVGKAKVVMVSDDLKPTSNLRKLFETTAGCVAIACYKDDPAQMRKYIVDYLAKIGATYEPPVPMALANLLPANRLLANSELDKLATYCNKKKITLEDVAESVPEGKELLLDELCLAFFQQNKKAIPKLLGVMIAEDTNFVLIIRVLLKYAMRLLEIKSRMHDGATAEKAVELLRPPVFFKQKDSLVAIAKIVSPARVNAILKKLLQLELDCKSGKLDPQLLTHNFLVLEL